MASASTSTAYDEAVGYLYARIDYERSHVMPYGARDFKLDRMRELLDRLGRPHERIPIVHVAGTKGKGSTSAMIAAVLSASGHRTGLFTSPHLQCVEERMRVDGQNCTPAELIELVRQVRVHADSMDAEAAAGRGPGGPTYFELTTAMALVHFVEQRVNAAVLEVGLGGRLDSTNVCQPEVAVITSISFDHTRQLGNTLSSIAWEKAGIVKQGVPTVSGVVDEEPRRVIAAVCDERHSRLVQLGRDFRFTYRPPHQLERAASCGQLDYEDVRAGHQRSLTGLDLRLLGRHQAANAAVAIAAITELKDKGWPIPDAALVQGLANVSWPARVEVVGRQPTVVIDAAHNVASIDALVSTLEESFAAPRRILIFATTRDKDVRGMLERLLPHFDVVVLTRYMNNPRNVPAEELRDLAAELGRSDCQTTADSAAAWELVRQMARPDDLICVTGSFFLAAEMRVQIESRPAKIETRPL
jgi:dihydrofolate synthase/folylpolyglutamate synthase